MSKEKFKTLREYILECDKVDYRYFTTGKIFRGLLLQLNLTYEESEEIEKELNSLLKEYFGKEKKCHKCGNTYDTDYSVCPQCYCAENGL